VFHAHPNRLEEFLFGWLAFALCVTAALTWVKTPYIKLLLTRAGGVLGATVFLAGAWRFSETTDGLLFATVGTILVVVLNLFTIRICPHCAKTLYPRSELARGFCPRCGANMGKSHERTATWHEGA
jgi:predicted RNA-binding Zn-ribbon protein involved in translation (DUF1610 family)